ncbi:SdiA-regulated domain-containing protein [Saprospiraceae bacterium]|nr:SdiA-regulated domain-containing protein [Saprospiraceae bacterium]MDC3210336.1 SdiA-regulated domain-containing protein [Saprospiraceae bacterium]MDG1433649.1 SdiA-regulated domain-containing protein [Saprospiraceae bacterium]
MKCYLLSLFAFICNIAFCQTSLSFVDRFDISGFVAEPSGLAYNKLTNELFTVSDANNIYRMSITGVELSTYTFAGDLEGISMYSLPNTLLVAIENTYEIIEYNYVTGNTVPHTMNYTNKGSANSGIEGVTHDSNTGNIYFLNEKNPGALIIADSNFVVTNEYVLTYAGDYSASYFVEETGFLWLGSDMESIVYKCNTNGSVIETFPITQDGTLGGDPLGKLEGIAIDYANNFLYIVSDAGQFLYVYKIIENPLPLELIEFDVSLNDRSIDIEWITEQEIDVDGYELYRSGDDGFSWDVIGRVPSKNVLVENKYSFIDDRIKNNNQYYYYLKMIDVNGEYTLSDIRSVKYESLQSIVIYPTVVKNELNIEAEDLSNSTITVYDDTGRVLIQKDGESTLDVSKLTSGLYWINIQTSNGDRMMSEFIKIEN